MSLDPSTRAPGSFPGAPLQPSPDDFLGYTIVRLAHVMTRRFDEALRTGAGVGTRQFQALDTLAQEPGIGSAALARRLAVTPQSAGPLVDELTNRGLVERDRSAGPGTVMASRLTEDGERVRRRCYEVAARLRVEDLAGMTGDEAALVNAKLLEMLRQLTG